MEDGKIKGVVGSSSETQNNKNYSEILDKWCAFYMSIGVSYDEYWHGDTSRLKYYVDAFKMQNDRDIEARNWSAYLAGFYNYNAVSEAVFTALWAVFGKKGKRPEGYMKHPLAFTDSEKAIEHKRNVQATIEWFMHGQETKDDANSD